MQEKNITEILPSLSPTFFEKLRTVREESKLTREECYGDDWSYEAVRLAETGKTHPSLAMVEHLARRTGWNPESYLCSGLHPSLRIKGAYILDACRMYLGLPRRNQLNVIRLLDCYKFHTTGDYGKAFLADPGMRTDPLAVWFLTYCATH